ncbi:MAG: hypothetical protein ACRD2W_16765 [Acidimicrobiales bacterium]
MGDITVKESDRGPLEFDVAVGGGVGGGIDGGGGRKSSYRVSVPSDLPDQLGGVAADTLVRESFAFLLEREPASAILPEFSLSVISRYFPEYLAEMKSRLA